MKYIIFKENGRCIVLNYKDIKFYNDKYSLFISHLENLVNNDRIIYLLKNINFLDRVKGLKLARKYYDVVVI